VFLEPPVPLCLPLSRLSNANDAKDQKKRNKESWNQAQRQRRHGAQFRNPTLPDHDFQSPRQGGAVQGKEFSQFALSQVSGTGEHLQDCELSHAHAQRPQFLLVELGQGPRHPAKRGAQARKGRQGCDSFPHVGLHAYAHYGVADLNGNRPADGAARGLRGLGVFFAYGRAFIYAPASR